MKCNQLNILFIGLLLFASISTVFAQQEFLIKGVITENGTSNRVALAKITNKRTKLTVGSNDMGFFQLRGRIGDTLVILNKDFSDKEIVISSDKEILISLNRSRTLSEVKITGQSRKQELEELKREYRNKGSFYAGKPPLLSYIFNPLTALYELFGRTPKNARRFNKYYNTEIQQIEIDGLFNETLIKSNTDLNGKDLDNFMLNYRPEYDQAKKWTQYDAIKYIRDSYKKYTDTLNKHPLDR